MKALFFLVLLLPLLLKAEIHETDSILLIDQTISQIADENTLILIDIGGTLIHHANPLAYKENYPWIQNWFAENAPHITEDEIEILIRDIRNENNCWILVDSLWPEIILKAHKKGANVYAFSKIVPDPLIRVNRLNRLQELGIYLNDEMAIAESKLYTFEKGVIETSLDSKGACLAEILKSLTPYPSRIIFIDNEKKHIDSVNRTCETLNISCIAIHFTANQTPHTLFPANASQSIDLLYRKLAELSPNNIKN